jgi:hypothetical protein
LEEVYIITEIPIIDNNYCGQITFSGSGIVISGSNYSNDSTNGFAFVFHPYWNGVPVFIAPHGSDCSQGFPINSTDPPFIFKGKNLSLLDFETFGNNGKTILCYVKL